MTFPSTGHKLRWMWLQINTAARPPQERHETQKKNHFQSLLTLTLLHEFLINQRLAEYFDFASKRLNVLCPAEPLLLLNQRLSSAISDMRVGLAIFGWGANVESYFDVR